MNIAHLLLNFIENERWYLANTSLAFPYYRRFDHNRYFKWGLVYFIDMIPLKNKNPDVFNEFSNGNHVVSRAKCSSKFNTGPTDVALQQSMNRNSKTKGNLN